MENLNPNFERMANILVSLKMGTAQSGLFFIHRIKFRKNAVNVML
ncbi:MAG: hypothetical protein ACD_79C00650G0014 [uncultured bacterium]|nr:MAG: hypothetical protein ACD_79C00650G0014 [uncultured bacterium]